MFFVFFVMLHQLVSQLLQGHSDLAFNLSILYLVTVTSCTSSIHKETAATYCFNLNQFEFVLLVIPTRFFAENE